ncbi:MAG: type II toxin-antitoxin system VapC family toxin, partial [Defluviitaleaceae bacterium]|nr:type II toxin-antitoxin system VapC family toxin [Defluviitaleaceae bacterium]
MEYILDTHVLLWSMFEPAKLSKSTQKILLDKNSQRAISISSIWEIAIKNRIGKLPLPNGIADVFSAIETRGYGILDIDQKHVEIFNALPLLHRDPFDGIIIATALLEKMTIVTADENI